LGSAVLVGEAGWLVLRRGRTVDSSTVPSPVPIPSPSPAPDAEREPAAELAVARGGTVTAIDFGTASRPSDLDDPRIAHDVDEDWANGHSADLPDRRSDPRDDDLGEPVEAEAPARRPKVLVGRRPFDLIPALILTAILTAFLVLAAIAEHLLGAGAAVATIAAAGLADSHAGALTAANLASQDTLAPETAVLAAMAALAANTVVKLILAHVAGGRRASTTLAALFAGPIVAIALGLTITLGLAG
jgi:hypothetical protein